MALWNKSALAEIFRWYSSGSISKDIIFLMENSG